ncbi:50S ribosomal protein L23 [Amphiplicatus metriothermophilus]|uniref:Large ribosomal subunit protein uL23 n=1 Tax=Amphiplicatus metriothermophilus TaxID=1519374 RepID=A0A239PPU5_9PROT|nr:50S ribosomal protein L23 [Amphiplicatus metriothermophilus]MBB5518546.1 large subunit ribosomal protein L23 [Amphiplicatus metriothermophilus]SNT72295.1 LSU ribosomal protein L23P [Amphiplicatus metriothermophilus]
MSKTAKSKKAAGVVEKHYDTLIAPVITEKSTIATENNQVVFRVPLDATKPEIAEAVEALFKVKVKAVNTLRAKGKTKQFRGRPYARSTVKKAIVTLEEGHSIDVTTGL